MKTRRYQTTDYDTICCWWKGHDWPTIPSEYLPHTGLIVDGYCSGFLYQTDSKLAWLEFIVSNPDSDKILRNIALNTLIADLVVEAAKQGFKSIFTSTNHNGLLARYQKHGFVVTDKDVTHLVRSL